ncbi:MAG TPA: hypothetical protein VN495_02895 [Candidatus Paceibacterota bacterium]|nr:hypothetical protein [Candidatus Paceibacterota bacterium]
MKLDALIIFVGAAIAVLPFLGFPVSWDHALFFFLGLCVVALGVAARRRLSRRNESPRPLE